MLRFDELVEQEIEFFRQIDETSTVYELSQLIMVSDYFNYDVDSLDYVIPDLELDHSLTMIGG